MPDISLFLSFSEDTLLVNIEHVDIAFHTRRGEARANTSAGEAKGGEAKKKILPGF